MPELSHDQIARLKRAHAEITAILMSVRAIDSGTPAPEPRWRAEYQKMWRLLKAVELAGSDIGLDEWRRLGVAHGYDPRGLGGFFRGAEPTMEALMGEQGARRVLTPHGRRFVERWEQDFGPYEP